MICTPEQLYTLVEQLCTFSPSTANFEGLSDVQLTLEGFEAARWSKIRTSFFRMKRLRVRHLMKDETAMKAQKAFEKHLFSSKAIVGHLWIEHGILGSLSAVKPKYLRNELWTILIERIFCK